jgi:outer membrane biosynthesis protein TonB
VQRRTLGPRFVPEALFIVGVAILAALLEVPIPAAIGLTLVAWILVVGVELALARQGRRTAGAAVGEPPATALPVEPAPVDVAPATVPVEPEHDAQVEEEPNPDPDPDPAPQPEPEPKPEPERVPAPPQLSVVPELEPDPDPDPDPEPRPVAAVVELRPAEPREWNVWDLERRARDRAGIDASRDQEWSYLLLYLREFASPEGTLPEKFDPLVRESFRELIETP